MPSRHLSLFALVLGLGFAPHAVNTAAAHGVTLKVQHAMPADSAFHMQFLIPWTQKVEKESGGRLHFHLDAGAGMDAGAMQLFDRVKAGDADVVWAAIDSAPRRFPALEVFELPFMANTSEGSSRALWEYVRLSDQAHMELDGMRALAIHQSPAPQFHLRGRPLQSAADLSGLRIAAASRMARNFLAAAGAVPVELAPSQTAEVLTKAEVDGLLLPWEMLPALEVDGAPRFHSEIDGSSPRLFSAVYVFAMNAGSYKTLPDDLKNVINANSGPETSAWLAKVLDESAARARKAVAERGGTINVLPAAEVAKWRSPAQHVVDAWIKDLDQRGVQGKELFDAAHEALSEYDRAQ